MYYKGARGRVQGTRVSSHPSPSLRQMALYFPRLGAVGCGLAVAVALILKACWNLGKKTLKKDFLAGTTYLVGLIAYPLLQPGRVLG